MTVIALCLPAKLASPWMELFAEALVDIAREF